MQNFSNDLEYNKEKTKHKMNRISLTQSSVKYEGKDSRIWLSAIKHNNGFRKGTTTQTCMYIKKQIVLIPQLCITFAVMLQHMNWM